MNEKTIQVGSYLLLESFRRLNGPQARICLSAYRILSGPRNACRSYARVVFHRRPGKLQRQETSRLLAEAFLCQQTNVQEVCIKKLQVLQTNHAHKYGLGASQRLLGCEIML